jgi:glycerol-3-phosphate acyltransferase PlsX
MPAFQEVKTRLDPRQVGAAPLLGINGLVFVGHGRSDATALINAIKLAHQAVEADFLPTLKQAIQEELTSGPSDPGDSE